MSSNGDIAAADFAHRLRSREPLIGYWIMMDSPSSTERIARIGYDFVCMDLQHGLISYDGVLDGLRSIDAGAYRSPAPPAAGIVRVGANTPLEIGRALDAGAQAVIVPVVDNPEQAATAVASARYLGNRSYGPQRSSLRIGPRPADADRDIAVLAMIETTTGLEQVERIAETPGLDGLYIGPSDLGLALGAAYPGDPAVASDLEAAAARIKAAAEANGLAVGFHTRDGEAARKRLAEGFTMTAISADLVHLEQAATQHLAAARG